jgi:hypothetical protein
MKGEEMMFVGVKDLMDFEVFYVYKMNGRWGR